MLLIAGGEGGTNYCNDSPTLEIDELKLELNLNLPEINFYQESTLRDTYNNDVEYVVGNDDFLWASVYGFN